jgi:hypothetical protein
MRRVVTGEQVAQIYNPDPFARPVFRAPVYQTPAGVILIAWLARFVIRLARLICRHPVAAGILALLAWMWVNLTWIGPAAVLAWLMLVLAIWRCYWPTGFTRWVSAPARSVWRAWGYRRRWPAVMTIADLAPLYRGRIILPVLVKVTSTGMSTGWPSGWSRASPWPTSPPGPTTWPTGSGRCCAGSVLPSRARWCWSLSAVTPWPPSSPPSRSRTW